MPADTEHPTGRHALSQRWLPKIVVGPATTRDLAWPALHLALLALLAYSWFAPPPYYPYLGLWFDLFGVPSIVVTALIVNIVLLLRGKVRWNGASGVGVAVAGIALAFGAGSALLLGFFLLTFPDF